MLKYYSSTNSFLSSFAKLLEEVSSPSPLGGLGIGGFHKVVQGLHHLDPIRNIRHLGRGSCSYGLVSRVRGLGD